MYPPHSNLKWWRSKFKFLTVLGRVPKPCLNLIALYVHLIYPHGSPRISCSAQTWSKIDLQRDESYLYPVVGPYPMLNTLSQRLKNKCRQRIGHISEQMLLQVTRGPPTVIYSIKFPRIKILAPYSNVLLLLNLWSTTARTVFLKTLLIDSYHGRFNARPLRFVTRESCRRE